MSSEVETPIKSEENVTVPAGKPGRHSKIFLVVFFSALAITIALCVRYFGFGGGSSGGEGEWGAKWLWVDDDPFEGEVYIWSHERGGSSGLSLRVVNALEERWHPYLDVAVMEWNNGDPDYPDVVNLQTSTTGHDPDCHSVRGVLKVCNDDYGPTPWKGQNSVLMNQDGYVISSVALMNDYYLRDSTSEDREYTMCHEIGHGLGLPHTDERLWNLDRGNCMDYTSRPGNNLKPGRVSFEELADAYNPTNLQSRGGASSTSGDDAVSHAMETFEVLTKEVQQNTDVGIFNIGSGFYVVIYRLMA